MVTGPRFGQEMFLSPIPVSAPWAPTVTTCAIFRPSGPPNEIGGCVCALPCCSFADTRKLRSLSTVCCTVPAVQLDAGVQSTTCTLKLKVPCLVGVPVNPPDDVNVRPGGSEPEARLKARVPCPPMTGIGGCVSSTTPSRSVVGVMSRLASTKTVKVRDAICESVSVACTVNAGVLPYVGGVPLSTPLADSDSPPRRGSPAVLRLHVTVPVAPPTASCWLYGVPTKPFGNAVVVTTGGPTLIVYVRSASCAGVAASRARIVNVNVP